MLAWQAHVFVLQPRRGTLQEVHAEFGPDGRRHVRGEVVLLVQGGTADPLQQLLAAGSSAAAPDAGAAAAAPAADAAAAAQPDLAPDEAVRRLVTQQLRAGASVSATARLLSRQLQVPRGRLYKLALDVEAQLQRDGSVG
jgi:pyruvate/2-oxoglutarate dehydrogenase complex dihydrolipoamide acyltransferase (E2) component